MRNTISLLYKQKTGWNSDIWNFFWRKFNFALYFPENRLFQVDHVWKRHCDVIRWPIFKILVSMERGDPPLYYGTTHSYFGHVNLKFMRGVVTTPPLRKMCYGKYLRKTRVNRQNGQISDILIAPTIVWIEQFLLPSINAIDWSKNLRALRAHQVTKLRARTKFCGHWPEGPPYFDPRFSCHVYGKHCICCICTAFIYAHASLYQFKL